MTEKLILKLEAIETLLKAQWTKKALTLEEAAAYLGLSSSYLYKLTSSSGIPYYKPRGKMIYFNREELDEWSLQKRVKTKAEIEAEAATYVTLNKRR